MGRWSRRRAEVEETDAPSRYVIALEEARRGLEHQRADRESIRNRSVALLGIASLVGSVAGGLRDSDQQLSVWVYLAAACVAVLVLDTLLIGWPWVFTFSQDVGIIIRWVGQYSPTEDDARRQLAGFMDKHYCKNARTIRRMVWGLQVGIVMLALELLFLALDLWGTR